MVTRRSRCSIARIRSQPRRYNQQLLARAERQPERFKVGLAEIEQDSGSISLSREACP